jgi:membrane protein
LNKAYGIESGLTFWKARIKVTIFTIVVGSAAIAAFSSVVIMPHVWKFLESTISVGQEAWWLRGSVRYGLAFLVLVFMYALMYGLLPDIPQTFRGVLPGALFGAALWIGLASLLSYTWRSAAELLLVYGGFAGLVATLVFLYLSTVTLILGAEVNAVLRSETKV